MAAREADDPVSGANCHNGFVGHEHSHAAGRAEDRARLRLVLVVTVVVMVLEVFGALVTGSLALLADAGHMATDAAAVVLALGASYVATLRGGPRTTFGLHRAEILAALVNALVLLVVCGYLAWAGISRLADPQDVDAGPMVLFALVGLVANAVSLFVLKRSDTGSLNVRGALNEVVADLLGSILAVVAGLVILLWGFERADPIASLVIAVLILPRSLVLLRDASEVLLEVAPAGLDLGDVRRHLLEMPGVVDVHDLHAWTITSGMPSLSAHVTVTQDALDEHGVGGILDRLTDCTAEHFDVRHSTFQVEPETHREHEDLGEVH
jgi:cobalt-zinc-cadmium efflux system protein